MGSERWTDPATSNGTKSGSDAASDAASDVGSDAEAGSDAATAEARTQESKTVTAATLARDQATIDGARAAKIEAEQALDGAVVTAPQAGRVLSVDVAAGDTVAAGTLSVVLKSGGVTTVVLAATTDQVSGLALGQQALVTPVGAQEAFPASVSTLATTPTTSTTGESTYSVTVALEERGLDLPEGAGAEVAITLAQADDVVSVPWSAVANGVAQVLADGVAVRTRISTGLVGAGFVEILDGLEEGDEVVLADLDEDVPTGDSETITGIGGGFGGDPGTGGPGAGGGGRGGTGGGPGRG